MTDQSTMAVPVADTFGKPRSWRLQAWSISYPEVLLVFLAAGAWIFLQGIRHSHDVFWQFWVARQMLGGAKLYTEIWELNPPLWFWSAIPIEWVAQKLGWNWQPLLNAALALLSATSAWLVGRLVAPDSPRDRLLLTILIFAITIVAPFGDVGQRDAQLLTLALPYAALIARRYAGLSTSNRLAILIGFLGACGFALKHYYILVPVVLELALLLRLRKAWTPFRQELWMMAISAVAYALSVILFTPGFFTVALPMALASYHVTNMPIMMMLFRRWFGFWILATLYLYVFRRRRLPFAQPETEAFYRLLPLLTTACVACFFMQQRGAFYHSVAASGILTLMIGLFVFRIRDNRKIPIALGALLLALPLSSSLRPTDLDDLYYKQSLSMFEGMAPGDTVFIASDDPRVVWPTVEMRQIKWPARISMMWMFPAIAYSEGFGHNTPGI